MSTRAREPGRRRGGHRRLHINPDDIYAHHIDVVGQGLNGDYYHKFWNGSSWSATWNSLGGNFWSAPAMVSWGSNRADLFGTGLDFTSDHRYWDGSSWGPSTFESLGGSIH